MHFSYIVTPKTRVTLNKVQQYIQYIFQDGTISYSWVYTSCVFFLHGIYESPYETLKSIHHYEDIYENSENLSKVTPVYGSVSVPFK